MRPIPFVLMLLLTMAAATSPAADPEGAGVLEQLGVDKALDSLPPAPIPGFVEVIRGMQVLYVSVDGTFVINGDILSMTTETNLTEDRRSRIRRDLIHSVADGETLIVPSTGPTIGRIVVFTDLDCRYCQLLQRQHETLSRHGIEIRYFFYPRSGPGSPTFEQAVAVWCSDDRLAALNEAFDGAELPESHCAHPVSRHYELARQLGLKGTPAVIAADGSLHYGTHSPGDILALITGTRRQ